MQVKKLKLLAFFHFSAILHFSYALYYDYYHVNVIRDIHKFNQKMDFGGKFKYLTYINLVRRTFLIFQWILIISSHFQIIQIIYFVIALLNDLFGTCLLTPRNAPIIRKLRDYVFATFAFPIVFNVGVTFWTLYSINRELVFPKLLDVFFPK